MFFHNRTSYHDYEGIAFEKAERERLQRDLGPVNDTMILRNHGFVTCGRTVADALHLTLVLERACQAQIAALAGGVSPRMPSQDSIEYTAVISRSEEHTSELQSLMRISYAVFCLKKKKK